MFVKIAVQAFESGNFLNIFLKVSGFETHFLVKFFLITKRVLMLYHMNKAFHFWWI